MKKIVLFALPALLLFAACRHNQKPDDVMAHEQMVAFLADAYLLEGFYAVETQYRYDVLTPETIQSYDSILSIHGVSREEVERSLDYYSHHLDEYQAIHEEVATILENQQKEIK